LVTVVIVLLSAAALAAQEIPGAAKITSGQPATLSYEQSVRLAIENNLATLRAHERRNEARGQQEQARAPLLPNISGEAYQASLTQNLVALGFQPGTFPGFNKTFLGPFKNFDARLFLSQRVFDLSAIRNYQAGKAGVRVAELQEALAREQVASRTGISYLEALRADRAVVAAQANVELARALLQLAQDQRNAGVATGVDVTRAQTRLAEQQVGLAQAQTDSEQARLNLQRLIGLPLGSPLTLTDQLRFVEDPLPSIDTAVAQAAHDRREIQVAEEENRAAQREAQAARAEHLPSLEVNGNYGPSGITPSSFDLLTRRIAVQLNVPIFNGGLTQGRVTAAASRERQTELTLADVRGQVEEDVRLALTTLRTAAVQVRAAEESVTLAERELEMSRDRFRAGVADNLEVITAQVSLANARLAQVTALAQHNAARLNLAAALGRAETFRW
jgi:outer membrane protein TolC